MQKHSICTAACSLITFPGISKENSRVPSH